MSIRAKAARIRQLERDLVSAREDLALAILERRKARGLSLRACAEELGCSIAFLRQLEDGSRRVPPGSVPRVVRVLDGGRRT
jgi:cyanate lyase